MYAPEVGSQGPRVTRHGGQPVSIAVMNLVWQSTLEGSSKRFVLLALADRADDEGYCWPGMQNLVEKTGLTKRTVHRACRELETSRLLLRETRWTERGASDTNAYWINVEALRAMQRPRKSQRGPHPMAPTGEGVVVTPPGCHGDRGEGVVVTPNTLVETSGSPQEEDLDQKNSASAASRQAATAHEPPKFDPPFDPNTDDPLAWIDEQLIGGYGPGEEPMADSMLDRDYHPNRIVNTINAQRYGSSDKSAYRQGRTDVLDRIGQRVGGYRPEEREFAMDLLLHRYSEDTIVEQIQTIHRPFLAA